MRYPKTMITITSHPAVETCDYGSDSGVTDYKYDVFLKEGWAFSYGRMAGGRTGHFNSVDGFLCAKPKQIT